MMRIGCIQFEPTLGNLGTTINSLSNLIQNAKDADFLVLPELCNSGYNFVDQKQAWESSESIDNSEFIQFLSESCKKFDMHIVSGFNERLDNNLYNSAVYVSPNGYIGKYQKLHLFNTEKDFFKPGRCGLPVFQLNGLVIGIQICFDWMYPEAWRILTLKNADIICHPSNLVLPGLAQKAVPVHAMINRVFTITANRIGSEGNLTFTGSSTIANTKGEILTQASKNQEEILIVDINPEESKNKWITQKNHILDDRRPQDYQILTKHRE